MRLNPSYADAHFYLAVTFEKMGLSHDAGPHWSAYRQLAPQAADICYIPARHLLIVPHLGLNKVAAYELSELN